LLGKLQLGSAVSLHHTGSVPFFPPEAVAPMVLDAVRHNRVFVFDHHDQRRLFSFNLCR
jgi:hypothetical protein